MNFPIEAVFAILAIEVFRSLAQPEDLAPPPANVVALATMGWIVWSYLSASLITRRTRRRLRRAQGSTVEILEDFRFRATLHKVVLVILCIAYVSFTRWPAFVESELRLPVWSVVDDLAAIAPFVAAMVSGWAAMFRIDKAISRRSWGLAEYIWFQARYSLLLVLGPWLALKAIDDSHELWPKAIRDLSDNMIVSSLFFALLVLVAAAYLPVFLKWLFRASTMEDGPTRTRLEAVCERAGMRFRDILVWHMDRARILNAGVMGVLPRYRFVMFSDALLEAMQPAECEAVLAHEIAHSKYKHPVIYLMFTLGFVALAYAFMELMTKVVGSSYLARMPMLAILVVVYFRFLFGYLSRAFERQADVYAAGLVGSPVPLMLALEKIALMSGDIRALRSWRHHSVSERVRFLADIGYDGERQARYHANMKKLWALVALSVMLFAAGAVYLHLRTPQGIDERIAKLRSVVEKNPTRHDPWTLIGELEAGRGRKDLAIEAFSAALKNSPHHERALRGLEGLDIPESRKLKVRALALLGGGFPEEAVEIQRKAIELEPRNASVHELCARALLKSGRLKEAMDEANRAILLEPDSESIKRLREKIENALKTSAPIGAM